MTKMKRETLRLNDPSHRRDWQKRLSMGPWLWPPPDDADFGRARAIVRAGPKDPAVGEVPLISISKDGSTATLWKLHAISGEAPSKGAVGFTPATEELWRSVGSRLPQVVPMLWQPLLDIARCRPMAIRMGGCLVPPDRHGREVDEDILEGDSFGLAFALAFASHAFKEPLRGDVIASAEVRGGEVGRVDGITSKVQGVCELAPRITRLLVHPDDVEEAKAAATGRLKVFPVRTVGAALSKAFRRPVSEMLLRAGRSVTTRAEIVDELFRLATGPRTQLVEWTPVRRAAEAALALERRHRQSGRQRWALTKTQRGALALAAAFAQRHETNGGRVAMPDRRWVRALPRPTRLDLMAHLVSQSTYTGSPSPSATARMARREIPSDMNEAVLQELKVMGSLARFDAVTGDPKGGLRAQQRIAEQLFRIAEYKEISYQLAEWYRLAGALSDPTALDLALAMETRVDLAGGLDADSRRFVTLARAQALAGLDRAADAEPLFRDFSQSAGGPTHLRWSGMRWLIRVLRTMERPREAESVEERLQHEADTRRNGSESAPMYSAMSRLDRGVVEKNDRAAHAALDDARSMEPGIITHLERAARRHHVDGPAYVARFYPD